MSASRGKLVEWNFQSSMSSAWSQIIKSGVLLGKTYVLVRRDRSGRTLVRGLLTSALALSILPGAALAQPFALTEAQADKVTAGRSLNTTLMLSSGVLLDQMQALRASLIAQLPDLQAAGQGVTVEASSDRGPVAVAETSVSDAGPDGTTETVTTVSVARDGASRSYLRRVVTTSR